MIIECPNCHKRFRLDENKITSGQAKLRCSQCAHVFPLTPAGETLPPSSVAPSPTGIPGFDLADFDVETGGGIQDSFTPGPRTDQPEPDLFESLDQSQSPPQSQPQHQADTSPSQDMDFGGLDMDSSFSGDKELDFSEIEKAFESPMPASDNSFPFPESEEEPLAGGGSEFAQEGDEPAPGQAAGSSLIPKEWVAEEPEPEAKSRSRRPLWILLAFLAIAGLGAATYFLYPRLAGQLPMGQEAPPSAAMEQEAPGAAKGIEEVQLQDVRQYFVNNEKIGELFVIEGKAVNRFPSVKEMIKVEAELYDAQGKVVQSSQFLCGNSVSLFQLQVLSREELNAVLQGKEGVLTNNTNVKPGAEVPFMTVFYNPPGSVQEFGLKVVEVKDPEK